MSDTTEYRMTITITPITEPELQAFVDIFRQRFGRKHLVHVIGKQPSGTHLDDAPATVQAALDELAEARDSVTTMTHNTERREQVVERLRAELDAARARLAALEAVVTEVNRVNLGPEYAAIRRAVDGVAILDAVPAAETGRGEACDGGGRHITQEMIDHLDAKAGKRHSAEGSVMTTLRELIEMYEASASR